MNKPKLIVIDGLDRVGKTTQITNKLIELPNTFHLKQNWTESKLGNELWNLHGASIFDIAVMASIDKYDAIYSMIKKTNIKAIITERAFISPLVYANFARMQKVSSMLGDFERFVLTVQSMHDMVCNLFDVHQFVFMKESVHSSVKDTWWTGENLNSMIYLYKQYVKKFQTAKVIDLRTLDNGLTDIDTYYNDIAKLVTS